MKEEIYLFDDFGHQKDLILTTAVFNEKKTSDLAVFYTCSSSDELNSSEEEQLNKILSAIGYSPGEVVKFNLSKVKKIHFSFFIQIFPVSYIMIFGGQSGQLNLNVEEKKYDLINLNEKRILFIDHLSVLLDNMQLKKELLAALKKMFNKKI